MISKIKKLLYLLLLSQASLAQSTLTGFVKELNSGRKPVANVIVKSLGANQTVSSSEGRFELKFPFDPGKNVNVRALKEGWEIVNEKDLNTNLPTNPNEKPLNIIICPAGSLAKSKSRYYETFEENLYNEFVKLKVRYKDNQKEIARLEEEYNKTQKQLNDLADEYSRINLDDATEKELQSIELFKAGRYDEFISVKNTIVTESEADRAFKNKKETAKIIANADSTIALYFKSQISIANTLSLQFKYEAAEELYFKMFVKDSTSFVRALKITKSNYTIGSILSDIGRMYQNKKDYLSAIDSYRKALGYYQYLEKKSARRYSFHVGLIHNKVGELFQLANDDKAALSEYYKALALFQPDSTADAYMLYRIYLNLGSFFQKKKEFPEALSAYQNALNFSKKLDPDLYEDAVAIAQTKIGDFFSSKGDYDSSLLAKKNALEINKKLFQNKPKLYTYDLAFTLQDIGHLYLLKKEFSLAANTLSEANSIFLELDGDSQVTNIIGTNYSNISWCQIFCKKFTEAEKSAREALIPTKTTKSDDYDEKIEWANTNLALALLLQGKYAEAERIYTSLKDKPYNNATYRESFLNDLDDLEKAGIIHPDMVKIKEILRK